MKHLIPIAAAAALLIGTGGAMAQNANAPGQQMHEKGSIKGSPGASGYAPGHMMQDKGSVKGTTGASGYAPGHATTGAGLKSDSDVKAGGMRSKTDIDAKGNVKVK